MDVEEIDVLSGDRRPVG